MKVLLADGNTRAALALARSLGDAGHTVHVAAPKRHSLAGMSRHCAGEFLQPGADAAPEEIAASLAATAADCGAERVAAMTDRTLTGLHLASPGLPAAVLPTPSAEHYLTASDKAWLFERSAEWGIAVPDGQVVEGGALPDRELLERQGTDWVLRPSFSWRWDGERWFNGKVRAIRGWQELTAAIENDPAFAHPYLVQRRLQGDGCGLFLCAVEGRINALFAHRRVREKPPWGGVSTLCRSELPPSDLVAAARRFVEETGWSGLAMLEFKREASDGKPYLLEVNARPWGSMALSRASGVDFARAWLTPERFGHEPGDYAEGVHLRWWWGDVDHYYLLQKEKGGSGMTAMLRGFARACVAGPRAEAWDTLRRDDPLPFAAETFAWLGREGG